MGDVKRWDVLIAGTKCPSGVLEATLNNDGGHWVTYYAHAREVDAYRETIRKLEERLREAGTVLEAECAAHDKEIGRSRAYRDTIASLKTHVDTLLGERLLGGDCPVWVHDCEWTTAGRPMRGSVSNAVSPCPDCGKRYSEELRLYPLPLADRHWLAHHVDDGQGHRTGKLCDNCGGLGCGACGDAGWFPPKSTPDKP